ncbi:RecB-like exonuclease/helicase [Microbacterium phage OscarSo]|uniref:RecB-like exonuclease/helicase n=1 Tax=Microbacterium phage OscarSo TaxID=2985324 RepID=A0A9X9P6E0_9CAUD|nr:RecB-like exonuclease/helicase [Microbacterium phage OscarSo]UYL87162.1 RecB-like exonuclease/helicase [Microbacterium phage OscarSo]
MGKKKEAAKLAAREAAIAAELERRAAEKAARKKAKKKAGKKAKVEPVITPADADVVVPVADEKPRHPHLAHLDRVAELSRIIADPTSKKKAVKAAEEELERYRRETAEREAAKAVDDAELKRKLAEKRAAREALSPTKAEPVADVKAARMPDALEGETEVDYQHRKLAEKKAAREAEKATGADAAEAELIARATEAVEAVKAAVEVVETEAGREFVAGEAKSAESTVVEEDFAKPSEAEPVLESGRNGYKIIMLDKDGKPDPRKVRQLTRITTYVGNIDDETSLKKWEKRLLAEGLAMDASSPESAELFAKVNDITHRRDVKIAKAMKADRKGKLGVGELGAIMKAAEKEAKDALDAIVEEALLVAGRNDKANFGSHLHTLAEISDAKGIDAVRQLHESGELVAHDNDSINEGLEPMPVTATDLASIEAYAARMERLGAKVLHSEAVVVNDELGNAGRLDRIITAKLPELVVGRGTPEEYVRPADTRARRYVADIKSGSLEYGAGKIARQLAAYAVADLYDVATGERTSHRAARDIALVFHLPLGEGTCSVYAVDLKAGIRMLKLSGEVRRARNTGKKAIDLSVDIADPSTATEEAGE